MAEWPVAKGPWEWLGQGIYAWEHAPFRALDWAKQRHGAKAAVVGMVIELDNDVLDLSDLAAITLLRETYGVLENEYQARGKHVPRNTEKRRDLDCLVINRLCERLDGNGQRISAVRGAFEEGERAFTGSMIRAETHVQIAVRDPGIIRGVFRPTDALRSIS
ncbi:MAG TPA: hypothetical protein VHH90_05950 [Polyangia bacterium]|nr:hypothetical protein [Polyangia bacterium]